jgi:diketogulonate reductase-like aldo/keto reductase
MPLSPYPMHLVWAQMEALVDEGLVKHIGVSNWTVPLLIDLFSYARIMPIVNEIEVHPFLSQVDLV